MAGAGMQDIIEQLDKNFVYIGHQLFDDHIAIQVISNREETNCPFCGKPSSRVHSAYARSFQDLPIQGKKVYITISNRKYFCDNPACPNTTFAEPFSCLKPKAKKSGRLLNEIMKVSLEVSSVTASRMLKNGVADISKSTICNILKKNGRSIGQGKNREDLHR
jgi:transposase